MRKALHTTMVATLLIAMLGAPATAAPADKTDVVPLDYTFEDWNPCTEQVVPIHSTGTLEIHALPSIDAFYSGERTHLTLKWIGRFSTDDGYVTQDKHFATQVVNAREGDRPHVVVNEVDNIVFASDDGGKYKVSLRYHITVVDGEPKTETDHFVADCIRRPEN